MLISILILLAIVVGMAPFFVWSLLNFSEKISDMFFHKWRFLGIVSLVCLAIFLVIILTIVLIAIL